MIHLVRVEPIDAVFYLYFARPTWEQEVEVGRLFQTLGEDYRLTLIHGMGVANDRWCSVWSTTDEAAVVEYTLRYGG